MSERLNKYVAFHLGLSRREADLLIEKGDVIVNGHKAVLGSRVEDGEEIHVKGRLIEPKKHYTYLILHKPLGYISSRKQQGDTPTLYALLPEKYHSLKPVGRLDKDTSGLLMLTDDGEFAHQMTHPKFYKVKVYQAVLNKALEPLHQQMISDFGIQLEDGPSQLSLERLDDSRTKWTITMHEGRNRQIRRTFAAIGYNVKKLHRISFGNYELGDSKPGDFKEFKP